MKAGFDVWRCKGCGKVVFPERLLCSDCCGSSFSRDTAMTAKVEEISMIHHMIGQENWEKRRIASVVTDVGCRITAGLLDDAGVGDQIDLFEEDGAPYGRAKSD